MPASSPRDPATDTSRAASAGSKPRNLARRLQSIATTAFIAAAVAALSGVLVLGVAIALAYPKLPDVTSLSDYRPNLPLRVYARGGELIGEFGEERRNLIPYADIPPLMIHAVLAIEDERFFEHGGVDFRGVARAALANVFDPLSQGASTITMQVARNMFLTKDRTFLRKFYEVLLTFKLERLLSKEEILEIYMNQIFLGHRSFGFAAAAQTYFGKSLDQLTVAEAAMLAGLPKAPSAFNPISNPRRARIRQLHIIDQMLANGFINAEQAQAARVEPLQLRRIDPEQFINATHVAEMVRQQVFAQYGQAAYERGLRVHTTIDADQQRAAVRAVRQGVINFERRQHYRGPERFIELPADAAAREGAIDAALTAIPDDNGFFTAVVLEASARRVLLSRGEAEPIEITGTGLDSVRSGLAANAPPHLALRPGAVVRLVRDAQQRWAITQKPVVEAAFVAMDPRNGEIRALVGGFDFERNQFNRVVQAQRQAGSSIKPFIYSAALEHGVMASTLVNDAPLFFGAAITGGRAWEPRNYDGQFEGPMTVRTALARSRNIPSISVLKAVGPSNAQQWLTRFGFEAEKHPPFLAMALGAGSVTPLQLASAYGVFANGGFYTPPQLITRITDHQGRVLLQATPQSLATAQRVISERNAFVMTQLMGEITRSGTAARVQSTLRRPDLYGKTGTTNDAVDVWFAGFHPTLSAVAWMGHDNPRNLGRNATGGSLALPIWIDFMREALAGVPVQQPSAPAGLMVAGGEWYYEEFAPGQGVATLGMATEEVATDGSIEVAPPMAAEDRRNILDLFTRPN